MKDRTGWDRMGQDGKGWEGMGRDGKGWEGIQADLTSPTSDSAGIFSNSVEDEVLVSASFPESNPFGLIVNGEQNSILVHLANQGTKNYTLVSAAASYHDVNNHWATVKNASALKYNTPLIAGANFSAPFSVNSEFRPQEIGLTVWVDLAESGSKDLHRLTALNQTVSVVEPASSWFDPQLLFLYLVISTALLGGAYAAYQSFFAPQTSKRSGKRSSASSGGNKVKAVVPNTEATQYPNVKPYEEDWIPESHLKSRTTKLKKRNTGAGGSGAASSGDELLTSGGEASGTEGGKKNKRKGKKA
ncbi:hypothetical protein I316_01263 [Kwoniella heveanensis BCC8398]|uniref:Uncharacterized protein n=1 Tax=Kwoniella heveanensis BCC8398 TaxID=1296120 RepID=A0A1B9H052_9TREE|nr:hypothetical protein I316_01263 [Kwoniella heveanensis BCC8398]